MSAGVVAALAALGDADENDLMWACRAKQICKQQRRLSHPALLDRTADLKFYIYIIYPSRMYMRLVCVCLSARAAAGVQGGQAVCVC
jgi:hypothetical protein